jgi:TolA-binding protein
MRTLGLLLLPFAIAAPAAAQVPISGLGNGPGSDHSVKRRWLGRADDRPERIEYGQRDAELAGQIRQLRGRIDDLRERGEISRAEARQMRREASRIAFFYSAYSSNGLSDSEAAELQSRLSAAGSLMRPSRPPAGR